MNKVSISEAAKLANISRSHLYQSYINTGVLSILTEDGKKLIEVSELIRVFGQIQLKDNEKTTKKTDEDTINTTEKDSKDTIIQLLESQLAEAKERAHDFKNREEWLQNQIDELRHQQSNLLEDKTEKKRKKFLGLF